MASPKTYIRESVKFNGWQVPPGNLLQLYLEACEQHHVVAHTGVASQLLRRVRATQPLPYHRALGAGRQQLLDMLLPHLDPAGSGAVAAAAAETALAMLNPRLSFPEALALSDPQAAQGYAQPPPDPVLTSLKKDEVVPYSELKPKLPPVPAALFTSAATACTAELSDAELCQGVLEVLAVPPADVVVGAPGLSTSRAVAASVAALPLLAQALFNRLDVSGEGFVTADDLLTVARYLTPSGDLTAVLEAESAAVAAAAAAAAEAGVAGTGTEAEGSEVPPADAYLAQGGEASPGEEAGLLPSPPSPSPSPSPSPRQAASAPPLLRTRFQKVSCDEFVRSLLEVVVPSGGMPPERVEGVLLELSAARIRPQHSYDFSRDFVGAAGLPPLVEALEHDKDFVGLNMQGLGVCDTGAQELAVWLKTHPCITSLDLSRNPIGDRGAMALTALLAANHRITQLNIDGIHLLRGYSRHHYNNLGPSACEDGTPIFEALQQNQAHRRKQPQELVRLLRGHLTELKALFYALADQRTGRMPLSALQRELRAIASDWGFDKAATETVVLGERLLGTGGKVLDEGGELHISFDEFVHFLETQSCLDRVMHAIKHHRVRVKRTYYSLMQQQEQQAAGQAAPQAPAGPGTAPAAAAQESSSSGGGAGQQEVLAPMRNGGQGVLLSQLLEALSEVALQPGSGWGVSLGDLRATLVPTTFLELAPPGTFTLRGIGCGAVVADDGEVEDLMLSWHAFFNTALHVLNR